MSQDTHLTTPSYRGDRWYVVNQAPDSPDEAEVSIYDSIGAFGIGAAQFVADLKSIKAGTIRVRLNTPGGEVFDATAIYNALREHPARVVVHVDGLAASAGSVIAMSGDEVRMADNAYMMIHEAWGGAMGDAEELRRYAGLLEKMNDNVAAAYQRKTGKPRSHWRKLMAEETWFTAKEAKAEGLADAVYAAAPPEPQPAAASAFDFKAYNKVPADVLARFAARASAQAPTTITNEPAPEPSPRGDAAAPESQPKEPSPMANDSTTTAPAPTPAAGNNGPALPQGDPAAAQIAQLNAAAIQSYIEKGRAQGYAEGRKAAEDRLRAIAAAAPGRADIALNAFLAGQDAQTVTLIHNAAIQAEANANQKLRALEVEVARLQALNAQGGVPGGVPVGVSAGGEPAASVPSELDPDQQAELEWAGDPLIRAKNGGDAGKGAWLKFRVNQLKGNVRVLKR